LLTYHFGVTGMRPTDIKNDYGEVAKGGLWIVAQSAEVVNEAGS
jgi:hypothetical protein